MNISREELAERRSVQLEHELAAPDRWRQYRFYVEEGDNEVGVVCVVWCVIWDGQGSVLECGHCAGCMLGCMPLLPLPQLPQRPRCRPAG